MSKDVVCGDTLVSEVARSNCKGTKEPACRSQFLRSHILAGLEAGIGAELVGRVPEAFLQRGAESSLIAPMDLIGRLSAGWMRFISF